MQSFCKTSHVKPNSVCRVCIWLSTLGPFGSFLKDAKNELILRKMQQMINEKVQKCHSMCKNHLYFLLINDDTLSIKEALQHQIYKFSTIKPGFQSDPIFWSFNKNCRNWSLFRTSEQEFTTILKNKKLLTKMVTLFRLVYDRNRHFCFGTNGQFSVCFSWNGRILILFQSKHRKIYKIRPGTFKFVKP